MAELLREVERLRRLAALYGQDHPSVEPAAARLREAAGALRAGRAVLEVRPSGFRRGEDRLPDRGGALRRLASALFRRGVVGVVLDPPVDGSGLAALAMELTRPGEAGGASRLLALAEPVRGLALVPLDVSRFVFGPGAGAGGGALWDLVVRDLTGGAVSGGPGGGADPREMAGLASGAGDPYGFLELLFERVLVRLGEAERQGRLLDALELLRAVRELVEALAQPARAAAARLLVRGAHPPESLAAGLAELLEPGLFLDAVEALLAEGVALPPAVERLVYQMAAPAEEAADPWRRRGLDLDPDTVERARALLVRLPALSVAAEPVEEATPVVELPEVAGVVERLGLAARLAAGFEEAAIGAELDRVLADAAGDPTPGLLGAVAERLLEVIRLGRFETAAHLAALLVRSGDEEALERVTGPEGVEALLEAFATAGKDQRGRIMAVVRALGEPLVPAMLRRLGEEENLSARRRLMEMVAAVGAPAIPHLAVLLHDRRWYVVRNALLLLRLLRDPEVGDRAAALLGHRDPRVVAEATRSLIASRDPRWLEGLEALLGSDDPRAFREGLAIAGKIHHPAVAARLLAQLERRRGRRLREPETLSLIETIGSFHLPEVVAALRELAELPGWRYPFRLTPVREAVARAAAKLPEPEGRRILERLAAQRDPAAEVARRALERREAGR